MLRCRCFGHLSSFLFFELSVSVVCYLRLIWGISVFIASNVSSVPSSGTPITR